MKQTHHKEPIGNDHCLAAWLVAAALILSLPQAAAQEAGLELDPQQIMIGQQARLVLQVTMPHGSTILLWPSLEEVLDPEIEIVRFGRMDTLSTDDKGVVLSQTHLITGWEEGLYPLPPLSFLLLHGRDTLVLETPARLLEVNALGVDPGQGLKDIKGILTWPVSFREILPILLGVLGLFVFIYFLIRWLRKKMPAVPEAAPLERPGVPPHIAALSGLERLRSRQLWQQGLVKDYHSELSQILRQYLARRFSMNALEMTTGEILAALPTRMEHPSCLEGIRRILELADRVKFARHLPAPEAHEAVMEEAIRLVHETGPKEAGGTGRDGPATGNETDDDVDRH